MLFALSIGRLTFELTRSDVLLKIGRREAYWSWHMGDPAHRCRTEGAGRKLLAPYLFPTSSLMVVAAPDRGSTSARRSLPDGERIGHPTPSTQGN